MDVVGINAIFLWKIFSFYYFGGGIVSLYLRSLILTHNSFDLQVSSMGFLKIVDTCQQY